MRCPTLGEIGTFVAIVAGIGGLFGIVLTQKNANDALFEANRAWIDPVAAQYGANFSEGAPLSYQVVYGNPGREPALGFVGQEDVGDLPVPTTLGSIYAMFPKTTLKDDLCKTTHANDDGLVRYPSAASAYLYRVTTDKLILSKAVIDGDRFVWVHGCFSYLTFGSERKSEYCFILLPERDKAKNLSFVSVACPFGNKAN